MNVLTGLLFLGEPSLLGLGGESKPVLKSVGALPNTARRWHSGCTFICHGTKCSSFMEETAQQMVFGEWHECSLVNKHSK